MSSYLLDTQALLMASAFPEEIPAKARKMLLEQRARLYLSKASVWEIAIKLSLGKIKLYCPLDAFLKDSIQNLGLDILDLETDDLCQIANLPFHHRDPFDRLLIVQAQRRNLEIISSDKSFDDYEVKRVW